MKSLHEKIFQLVFYVCFFMYLFVLHLYHGHLKILENTKNSLISWILFVFLFAGLPSSGNGRK